MPRSFTQAYKKGAVLAALVLCLLAGLSSQASACLSAQKSVYQEYQEHTKVFVGTVLEKNEINSDSGYYEVQVEESFKGLRDDGNTKKAIPVTYTVGWKCGMIAAPKVQDRVLVFMNDGASDSKANSTFIIWPEGEQTPPKVNPLIDTIVLLRQMLQGDAAQRVSVVAPNEETAIHLALQAMLPVFGKDAVAASWPLTAKLQEGKSPRESVWHVAGTPVQCKSPAEGHCVAGALGVDVEKITGKIIRVSSGD